jgi:hypothetical protein
MFLIFCILLYAIEIGDLDQKAWLAKEFAGFIVRCVHDKNVIATLFKNVSNTFHNNTCISFFKNSAQKAKTQLPQTIFPEHL